MKIKNLLGISALLLLVACSDEQPFPTLAVEERNMSVTLTAAVDSELQTRAEAVPSGYQRRYTLEVRATGTTDVKVCLVQTDPNFSFLLAKGAYDFLMWADYIESDAEDIEEDLYYDTSNLNAIIRTAKVPETNTEALDAFAAVVTKTKTSEPLEIGTVNLVRPFARMNLVEKEVSRMANLAKIEVDYTTEPNQSFNVQTNSRISATGGTKKTRVITDLSAEDGTFFFDYLFATDAETTTGSSFTVRLYTGSEASYKLVGTVAIPVGMPYQRNKQTDLTAYYALSSASVTPSVTEWVEAKNTVDIDAIWDGTYPPNAAAAISMMETVEKSSDGVYLIETPDQLAAFAYLINYNTTTNTTYRNYNCKLMTDIDLHKFSWITIGTNSNLPYSGVFDGNGHRISGLNVVYGASGLRNYVGLFGYMQGTIQYLIVEGTVVGGGYNGSYSGGIVGSAAGRVRFCSFEGTVTTTNSVSTNCAGGIAGSGTVENCISLATNIRIIESSGTNYIGGLSGGSNAVSNSIWLTTGHSSASGTGGGNGTNCAGYSSKASILSVLSTANTGATDFRWVAKDGQLALEAINQ
ncbi:MAG: hypothetical protein LBM61_04135 [Prevotellaceae bacterium]|jgi:hypothetical protein|nr:hypothetical protein [Prevotellaceae bacterium]